LQAGANPAIDNTTVATAAYQETGSNIYTICRSL
jgi:hypothetical protein